MFSISGWHSRRIYVMDTTNHQMIRGLKRGLIGVASLAVVGAACGSSTHSATPPGTSPPATSGPATSVPAASGTAGSATAYTVSAQQVGTTGTLLVNGDGRTLYLLSSEKGGKLTCTDANGCTTYWAPVKLPSGVAKAVAGSGVNASLLSSVRSSTGVLYVTYGGWPLYTFSGDSASGSANGVGVVSFGGTWYGVSTSGGEIGKGGAVPTTTGGSSGGGYGGGY